MVAADIVPDGVTLKASIPGPFTLSGRLNPNRQYPDRYAITEALLPLVRDELTRLVDAGCREICVDEPSMSCYAHKEDTRRFVDIFNRTIEPIVGRTRVCMHMCFGNYKGRSIGSKRPECMFPDFLQLKVNEMHLEMATLNFVPLPLIEQIAQGRDRRRGGRDRREELLHRDAGGRGRADSRVSQICPARAAGVRARLRLESDGPLGRPAEAGQHGRRCPPRPRGAQAVTLIEPFLADDALRADIEAADPGDGLVLWWLGQSGFLVKSAAGRVLFDPYLSDSLTRKYEHTDKPHVRMTRRAIAPGELPSIDVVTSSHNHTDHLDAETLIRCLRREPDRRVRDSRGESRIRRRPARSAMRLGRWDLTMASRSRWATFRNPCRARRPQRNRTRRTRVAAAIWAMSCDLAGMTVYHSGDTLRYPGMAELLRPFAIDVALLPINGNRPERRVAGNLFGDEAAQLARDIGARLVVPCHYEMFEFNTESPDLFVETCRRLGQPYQVLALRRAIVD